MKPYHLWPGWKWMKWQKKRINWQKSLSFLLLWARGRCWKPADTSAVKTSQSRQARLAMQDVSPPLDGGYGGQTTAILKSLGTTEKKNGGLIKRRVPLPGLHNPFNTSINCRSRP
jgi:hypothetical protein